MNGKGGKVYRNRKGTKKTGFFRRSNLSKKRQLNRYEMESPLSESASTSAKKLKLSEDCYGAEVNEVFGYLYTKQQ